MCCRNVTETSMQKRTQKLDPEYKMIKVHFKYKNVFVYLQEMCVLIDDQIRNVVLKGF